MNYDYSQLAKNDFGDVAVFTNRPAHDTEKLTIREIRQAIRTAYVMSCGGDDFIRFWMCSSYDLQNYDSASVLFMVTIFSLLMMNKVKTVLRH